jgi:hypothetical protein
MLVFKGNESEKYFQIYLTLQSLTGIIFWRYRMHCNKPSKMSKHSKS